MDGRSERLVSFLDKGSVKFIIPVYQRNYDWGTSQCKRLYDDLIKLHTENSNTHFFGSIVSSVNDYGVNEYLIIDGQQRLTTVSLLLLAIYKNIKDENLSSDNKNLAKMIYNRYLVDEYAENKEERIKLRPVKRDQKAYIALFEEDGDIIENSNISINFDYFYQRMQKEEISVDALFEAFKSLEIINIELKQDDNPQLIFESLNSTGLALKEGDKIRNFLLMDADFRDQERFYNDYWRKIEDNVKEEMDRFIRDYLSAKRRVTPAFKRIYDEFKEYVNLNDIDKEEILKDLLLYAKNYNILLTANIKGPISAVIKRLNKLETKVTRPFFLEILKNFNKANLDEKTVYKVFLTIENYIFRRNIVKLPTNALNKIFLTLFNEVYKIDKNFSDYINKLNYILLKKTYSGRFPRNEEFIENLSEREIYQMNKKMLAYIMERFENRGSREDRDIYRHLEDGNYSVEHIMPQTLNTQWKESLGKNYEQIHEKWLHRLANLTLTAYNSRYSNSDFETKKTIEDGYIDSGLRMNQNIAKYDRWTEKELEDRDKKLMELALKIWPEISTDYKIEKNNDEEISLEDDESMTGEKIKSYKFEDREVKVKNWVDMYLGVLDGLFDKDSSILVDIANKDDNTTALSNLISFDKSKLTNPELLRNGIYVEKLSTTNEKLRKLRLLFDLYNLDYSTLSFVVA